MRRISGKTLSLIAILAIAFIAAIMVTPHIFGKGKGGVTIQHKKTNVYVGEGSDTNGDGVPDDTPVVSDEPYITGERVPPSPTSRLPPAEPLEGTAWPSVSAASIRYDASEMDKEGWFKVQVRAYWKSCGPNEEVYTFKNPHRRVEINGTLYSVLYGVYGDGGYGRLCLTGEEIKKVHERYNCFSANYPPSAAWACIWYRYFNGKLSDKARYCPMAHEIKGITWFLPRDKIEEMAGKPCGEVKDYLIIESRLLYSPDGKKYEPYGDWKRQVYMRVGVAGPSTPEEFEEYSRNIEFLEVNGYVHAILPEHSLLGINLVMAVNLTEILTIVVAQILSSIIWWKWVRRWVK